MLLRHHESTQDLEQKHLRSIQELRDIHLKKQHHTERENQKEYNTKAEQDLRKKHALEQKQQPRSLRVSLMQWFKPYSSNTLWKPTSAWRCWVIFCWNSTDAIAPDWLVSIWVKYLIVWENLILKNK